MDVADWLRSLDLERYAEAFQANDIDAEVLTKLTAEDLLGLGVTSIGHRRKLLDAIAALRDATSPGADRPSEAVPEPAVIAAPRLPEAERRQLTVLLCDLVGSTELTARLDPEDAGALIRIYQACVAEAVKRWGGHVAKYMGDGVLAYFGWPAAHEDDAERAVRAGLDLAEAVGKLRIGAQGCPLAARVGIATGLVMVGELIGEGAAREQAVVGDTPNLAARLQALAEPGNVVIDATCQRLVSGLFDYADLGEQRLKGFKDAVRAWRVLRPSRVAGRFEALHGRGLTEFVGREYELGLLLDQWQQAKSGEGQVALISGEPGIGKSRLTQIMRERLSGERHVRLRYQCSPFHTNSALHPIIEQLERAAGFAPGEDSSAQLDKLEALLARSGADVADVAPLFASRLGVRSDDRYPPLNLTPQRQKEKILAALLDQLAGLARHEPVLLVFEDIHWIDPTSQELLDRTVDAIHALRVLALVTYRPEFRPPWIGLPHVRVLTLNRLGQRQGAAIVERVSAGKTLPAEVLQQIVVKTDGVPLFVEELTKTVLESGLLHDAGDRYELAGPLRPLAIPSTLHDSLMARLDRLETTKETAQIGAVIGRTFPHELLAAISPLPAAELNRALAELVNSELVLRRGSPPHADYVFKHALVQDAAYASLLKSRRQQLHAQIARKLEAHFPDTEPELLAQHFAAADLAEPAVDYWLKAGRRSIERSAYLEAIAHLRNGLELTARLPDDRARSQKEYELQSALGGALVATRGFAAPEVEEAYLRAREACERLGDVKQLFPVTWGLWLVYQQRCRLETARELLNELFRLAEQTAEPALLLQAHHAAWTTLAYVPELAACWAHAERGIALYECEAHRALKFIYGGHDPGVCCRYNGAVVLWQLGYPDRAVDVARASIALAEELDHLVSLALALLFTSFVHHHRGEPTLVQALAERTITVCAEQGLVAQASAAARIMRGWALAARGNGAEGIAQIRNGLEAVRATRVDVRRAYYTTLLAEACGMTGDANTALAALDEARALTERTNDRRWEAEIHRLSGTILLMKSHTGTAAAAASFTRAMEVAQQQEARSLELRAATSLARLWAEQGRRAEAHDLLAPVYGWFTEGFATPDLAAAKALLAELR